MPFQPAATMPMLYPEHSDLSYYLDANGYPRPILTPTDWQVRRQHVLAHMQTVMGQLPDRDRRVPMNMLQLEHAQVDKIIRDKIEYRTEADTVVRAYLFRPAEMPHGKRPGILCLHQTV